MVRQMLLLSSSKVPSNGTWMGHAKPWVTTYLRTQCGDRPLNLAFVPYAAVTVPYEQYVEMMRGICAPCDGFTVHSLHENHDPKAVLGRADAILVGGGNTWVLNQVLHQRGLVEVIRHCVGDGIPYLGWSAGAVVACAGMETTNDMNVAESPVLPGLDLLHGGLRLNSHFADGLNVDQLSPDARRFAEALIADDPAAEQLLRARGETRADRIKEYLAIQDASGRYRHAGPVIGLYEGGMLQVQGSKIMVTGVAGAKLFVRGEEPVHYNPGENLSFLARQHGA